MLLLETPLQALSHEVGESIRLPGGITSVDHVFRLPLDWTATESMKEELDDIGKDAKDGKFGWGSSGGASVEVFAR